jgi:hypothetical protein
VPVVTLVAETAVGRGGATAAPAKGKPALPGG